MKQTTFRIDGVFESDSPDLPTYFVEVQFQADHRFFDRTIAEIILYLSQTETITNWHFVIWVTRANLLPALPPKYQLFAPHISIFYLNRLPESESLGVGIVDLIVCPSQQAQGKVSQLLSRVQNLTESTLKRQMVDLMETVLVYKFGHLSRKELEAMFGLSELKQTRVYQEAKEEGLEEGVQIGRQEGMQIGRQGGVRMGEARLLSRLLSRRFGSLSKQQQEQISALPFWKSWSVWVKLFSRGSVNFRLGLAKMMKYPACRDLNFSQRDGKPGDRPVPGFVG